MRWLACQPGPNFSVHDLHVGWCEALRAAGETVVEYPLASALTFYDTALLPTGANTFRKALTAEQATHLAADRLAGALWKVRPDALMLTSGFFLDPLVFERARLDGCSVVLLATEQPYELARETELARHCDITVVNDPTTLPAFQQVCEAYYQPHSYRPSVHTPGPALPELAADLAFVGTGYPSRIQFLEAMDLAGLDVLLAGNWQGLGEDSHLRRYVGHDVEECLDNDRTVDVYRSMKVGLNLYRREAERPELSAGWAVGPREVEMAACGAFWLREPRGEGDELFDMLPTFDTPEQASALLRWYLNHPDERQALARKARESIQDRTFDQAAARLLRLLSKE